MSKIIGAIGEKPDRLIGGYEFYNKEGLLLLGKYIYNKLLDKNKINYIISGLNLGFETAVALSSIKLGIPLVIYKDNNRDNDYISNEIMKKSYRNINIDNYYEYIVEHSNVIIMLYDYNLRQYRDNKIKEIFDYCNKKENKTIINLWDDYFCEFNIHEPMNVYGI